MKKLNRIKEHLDNINQTQSWLAHKLYMSYPTVASWVSNKTQPNLTKLDEIANILGVKLIDLIEQ